MSIPRVFISYSHDNSTHKKWVLEFATKLRKSGIDAIIDQWDLSAGDDLPAFVEKNLRESDYVLMICTNQYIEKANSGVGGVGYEKMIITSEFMKDIDSNKIIPIIRQEGTTKVPTFLKSKIYIDMSYNKDFEFSFDELIRKIHDAPLYEKPEISNNPFEAKDEVFPKKTKSGLHELIKLIVRDFENGLDMSNYKSIVNNISISRIFLDEIIDEAIEKKLISKKFIYSQLHFVLNEKGKEFAIKYNIVKE